MLEDIPRQKSLLNHLDLELSPNVLSVVVDSERCVKPCGIASGGWDTLKTDGREYRLRLNYRYRMRYRVTGEQTLEIEIFYIGHRKDAYR